MKIRQLFFLYLIGNFVPIKKKLREDAHFFIQQLYEKEITSYREMEFDKIKKQEYNHPIKHSIHTKIL